MQNIEDFSIQFCGKYNFEDHKGALAILAATPEFGCIQDMLLDFSASDEDVIKGGGGKGPIASRIESKLHRDGFSELGFTIDCSENDEHSSGKMFKTHKIDCFRNRVALEIEWNTKLAFFDRDLNVFRVLHDKGMIDVGVIMTRAWELEKRFQHVSHAHALSAGLKKPKTSKYGASTTHFEKLVPMLWVGHAGNCPVLAIAIKDACFN